MLRRYAIANALFAFTRRLRPANQALRAVRGVEEIFAASLQSRRGAGGVVEATSARRRRGSATGDAPQLYRTRLTASAQMLRRYAVAKALFAFTRRLRSANQALRAVRGVDLRLSEERVSATRPAMRRNV